MENLEFKDKFKERFAKLTDWEEFVKYNSKFLRRSIRVNTLKISVKELKKRIEDKWHLQPVKWCKEGFFIEHKGLGEDYRRDVGNLTEHSLGYIFIQEASSMIPPRVLLPEPGDIILDMCASPGSKTTQIAQYMNNEGLLVANDYKFERNKALGLNLQRSGVLNTVMTLKDARKFSGFSFDKILIDAPCSGTGTIRKSPKTMKIWNPNMIKRLAKTQRELIENAFNNLRKGGVLVYSTCSIEPEENESVVSYLLDKYENATTEQIEIDINKSSPVDEFENARFNEGVRNCLRIWPQDNDTDGFFVCRIRKL